MSSDKEFPTRDEHQSKQEILRPGLSEPGHQCVVAVYADFEEAKAAVRHIESNDIPHRCVSLVRHSVKAEVPDEEELDYGDKSETYAAKGAGAGGLLGLLLGAPIIAIPGIGPVLLAGPIATGMVGAIVGGFLGAMSGWGVARDRISKYEQLVREGKTLIVVHGEPDEVARAKELLQDTEAERVRLYASTSVDDPSIDDRTGK
jgi:hypothetical protein